MKLPDIIQKSAEEDALYLLSYVNNSGELDAELFNLNISIEDEESDLRYDVLVTATIHYGIVHRNELKFQWEYYVEDNCVKFWSYTDINILANELKHQIEKRRCNTYDYF